ncbi:hypothetical protein OZX72_09030 [Bifidobacterium sp. ESL0769]|uniref:hypothetical protein n=1 Tax=Bifidobacterium sp. ESL0769 TaxID=2983229 RepID=UPI0023F93624|nr:hypothetical protein [Bifidobacterium sp. ESL0769]WEV67359.1 hypothetical protein OZX72_09030 [Bifidobacterium sp. ESL0769]
MNNQWINKFDNQFTSYASTHTSLIMSIISFIFISFCVILFLIENRKEKWKKFGRHWRSIVGYSPIFAISLFILAVAQNKFSETAFLPGWLTSDECMCWYCGWAVSVIGFIGINGIVTSHKNKELKSWMLHCGYAMFSILIIILILNETYSADKHPTTYFDCHPMIPGSLWHNYACEQSTSKSYGDYSFFLVGFITMTISEMIVTGYMFAKRDKKHPDTPQWLGQLSFYPIAGFCLFGFMWLISLFAGTVWNPGVASGMGTFFALLTITYLQKFNEFRKEHGTPVTKEYLEYSEKKLQKILIENLNSTAAPEIEQINNRLTNQEELIKSILNSKNGNHKNAKDVNHLDDLESKPCIQYRHRPLIALLDSLNIRLEQIINTLKARKQ